MLPVSDETLYFEGRHGAWFRYGCPGFVLVYTTATTVLAVLEHHWWLLGSAAAGLLSGASVGLGVRTRTVVTRDKVIVGRGLRQREIPASQIQSVRRHTAWEPVALRLVSGETVVLPRVAVVDVEPIARLISSTGAHTQ